MSSKNTKRYWIFGSSLAGIFILLAALIAANIILGGLRWRLDLTEEKLFTLTDGTRRILENLESPVTLKLFFSERSSDVPLPLKNFARQVSELLKEYQLAAGGRIILETYDPRPDSEAEEWAERYGLAGQNLSLFGAGDTTLYCGLVAVKGDFHATIPFIDPRHEELLEYSITRLITRVALARKPVLGLMSSLPVMGVRSFPYAMPGQARPRSQPPWVAFQNLAEDYEIHHVDMETEAIDAAIDALLLIHPKNLTATTQFAIDQFILGGGRLLAFIDPLCLVDAAQQEDSMNLHGPANPRSDLGRLLEAWGVEYAPDKILADMRATTRIQQGHNQVEDSPVFLSLRETNIDGQDTLTANLKTLILPCAGAFSGQGVEGLSVSSLLVSSEQSQLINALLAQSGAENLRREFQPGGQRLSLALRLQGIFPTAFPDGKPAGGPEENAPPAPPAAALQQSRQPTTVILVADVDLLGDQFAVQELSFFGQRVFQPINDNLNFFFNALEQMAGSVDLASVRCRGRFERPFDRVLALQHEAQQRWFLQERALQEKLDATRQRLEALQASKDQTQRYILSPEQEEEINRFKEDQIRTQAELKKVRQHLRQGIESLGVIVKAINIALMPALIILAGTAFGWSRRRRQKQRAQN